MNGPKPLISVGMPVYNGEAYIADAIRSVLAQTYTNFELIISDNASTDGTEKICREFAAKDPRIVYMRNITNIGAAKNFNYVFKQTSGSFFRWHNADDLCDPKLHELCLSMLLEKPDTVICYGKTRIIDSQGNVIQDYDDNLNLQQEKPSQRFKAFFKRVGLTNIIYGLMRRSAVEKTMLMGNGTFFAADTNFMAEMTLYGKFLELQVPLFFRRMHVNASSWSRKNQDLQKEFWIGSRNSFFLPNWKKEVAYFRSINNAPLQLSEKIKLLGFSIKRTVRRRRKLLLDVLHEMQKRSTAYY